MNFFPLIVSFLAFAFVASFMVSFREFGGSDTSDASGQDSKQDGSK